MNAASTSGLRDNRGRGKAGNYLAGNLNEHTDFSAVSAYFTVHAYYKLRAKLDRIQRLRFLFGSPEFLSSLGDDKADKSFALTEEGLALREQMSQSGPARACAQWINSNKVEIRSVKQSGFLHGKMYHLQNQKKSHALLGSSNFTVAGLGLSDNSNVELNLVVNERKDRDDLLAWFNEWWEDEERTEDVKGRVLEELKRLYECQAPQFIYYLTLFHVFGEMLAEEEGAGAEIDSIELSNTGIWNALYGFQRDGARAIIKKIRKFNGCILADSVGLGKTYTALAVIKHFELRNERVLVLCPKRLRRNWTVYRNNDIHNPFNEDRFGYTVLSHTDLSRTRGEADGVNLETHNWGNYDLLVIDESHNFRNNKHLSDRDSELGKNKTRYQKLIEDIIEAGANTKVLLLSATPVNNQIGDLRNQISIIAGGDVTQRDEADRRYHNKLGVSSIRETARQAQRGFNNWANQQGEKDGKALVESLGSGFFTLLDGLSIARSRKQIERYYQDEMDNLGHFPKRAAPVSLHPSIDSRNDYLSFEALSDRIDKLTLALYHPSSYLRDGLSQEILSSYNQEAVKGFTQEGRERILIGMMKINFLKRLESSVHSFCRTLGRTIEKMTRLERQFEEFEQHQSGIDYALLRPDDDTDEADDDTADEADDPETNSSFIVGGKQKFHLEHIAIERWRQAIEQDKQKLQELYQETEAVTQQRDAKLALLAQKIHDKLQHPTIDRDQRKNHKVLIFTAFADTAEYLYGNLRESIRARGHHAALVRGGDSNKTTLGQSKYDEILTNFSPRSKGRGRQTDCADDEIDVLIATDCISEGQNLQDCDLLINYDIHWNPVRIIQRFGRIDRIGSRNDAVRLINFWPTEELDRYLRVKPRVEERMALVDVAATQTDNLLKNKQFEALVTDEIQFRDKQLKALKEEIPELEELDESVSLGDFSLEDFRMELLRFLETRRKELEKAPLGLYAVVPSFTDEPREPVQPGVIFCLQHRKSGKADERQPAKTAASATNPLRDYYLVYVLDDGRVRLKFTQPKQTLDLFRKLAAGRDEPLQELCKLFDQKTEHGAEMSLYNGLMKKALASIREAHGERGRQNLLAGRGGRLPKKSESPTDSDSDYDLVTWLVILSEAEVAA